MPVDNATLLITIVEGNIKKVILAYAKDEDGTAVDFITGEAILITNAKKVYKYNSEFPGYSSKAFFSMVQMDKGRQPSYVFSSEYPEYLEDYERVETFGDAIEFVQKFPIEMQRDYTNADFSNSMVIDDGTTIEDSPKILKRIY